MINRLPSVLFQVPRDVSRLRGQSRLDHANEGFQWKYPNTSSASSKVSSRLLSLFQRVNPKVKDSWLGGREGAEFVQQDSATLNIT